MVATSRILVVDDEPVVTRSCQRILAPEGHRVDFCHSGREGLRRAMAEDYDLVMTDLKMPDLDGMDLVRELRRDRPGLAVIVITGYGTVPTAVQAIGMGVRDYIEKPFTPEQILTAVAKALPEKPGARQIEAVLVRSVLRTACRDDALTARLLDGGSRALNGSPIGAEAKAAIVSGDAPWIERQGGPLTVEQKAWLHRRQQAEVW